MELIFDRTAAFCMRIIHKLLSKHYHTHRKLQFGAFYRLAELLFHMSLKSVQGIVEGMWLEQNGPHGTASATIDLLNETFNKRIPSRNGLMWRNTM